MTPVRDGSRDGPAPARRCPACDAPRPSARARSCGDACKQRAYRLRHAGAAPPDDRALAADLKRRGALAAHTVYACPSCEARFVGERRCPDCNRFCRALGLGARCPDCDQPILLADLLGPEVLPPT